MEKKRKRRYTWYVEPMDTPTNDLISSQLPEEDYLDGPICADGKKPPLWRCNFDFIYKLQISKQHRGLKFNIYCREGGGKIRKWEFFSRKKRKKKLKTAS